MKVALAFIEKGGTLVFHGPTGGGKPVLPRDRPHKTILAGNTLLREAARNPDSWFPWRRPKAGAKEAEEEPWGLSPLPENGAPRNSRGPPPIPDTPHEGFPHLLHPRRKNTKQGRVRLESFLFGFQGTGSGTTPQGVVKTKVALARSMDVLVQQATIEHSTQRA